MVLTDLHAASALCQGSLHEFLPSVVDITIKWKINCLEIPVSRVLAYLHTACPNPAYCMGMWLQACVTLATYEVKLRGAAKCNAGLACSCILTEKKDSIL